MVRQSAEDGRALVLLVVAGLLAGFGALHGVTALALLAPEYGLVAVVSLLAAGMVRAAASRRSGS